MTPYSKFRHVLTEAQVGAGSGKLGPLAYNYHNHEEIVDSCKKSEYFCYNQEDVLHKNNDIKKKIASAIHDMQTCHINEDSSEHTCNSSGAGDRTIYNEYIDIYKDYPKGIDRRRELDKLFDKYNFSKHFICRNNEEEPICADNEKDCNIRQEGCKYIYDTLITFLNMPNQQYFWKQTRSIPPPEEQLADLENKKSILNRSTLEMQRLLNIYTGLKNAPITLPQIFTEQGDKFRENNWQVQAKISIQNERKPQIDAAFREYNNAKMGVAEAQSAVNEAQLTVKPLPAYTDAIVKIPAIISLLKNKAIINVKYTNQNVPYAQKLTFGNVKE